MNNKNWKNKISYNLYKMNKKNQKYQIQMKKL